MAQTDGSREGLASGAWPDPVRKLIHNLNGGMGAAVRTDLAAARGKYAVIARKPMGDLGQPTNDYRRKRMCRHAGDLKLHLGCGSTVVGGWENIDKSPNVHLTRMPGL